MSDAVRACGLSTWKKYKCIHKVVRTMSVRDKRTIFALMRNERSDAHDALMLEYGITLGEFCSMHVLASTAPTGAPTDETAPAATPRTRVRPHR